MLRWILLALSLACFGAASVSFNTGHLPPALGAAGAGVALMALGLLELDKRFKALAERRRAQREAARELALAPPPAPPPPSRRKGEPAGPELAFAAAAPRKPLLPESIEFSWSWVGGIAAALALAGQFAFLVKGSVLGGLVLTAAALYLGWRWMQRKAATIRVGLLKTLPQLAIVSLISLGLWAIGARMIWGEDERSTYWGVALTWLGALLGAWAASRFIERPLLAAEAGQGEAQPLQLYSLPKPAHDRIRSLRWVLFGAAGAFLLLSHNINNYILSLAFMVLAIALCMLAFPVWDKPVQDFLAGLPFAGAGLSLSAAAAGLWMGFHGQDLIERGSVNAGLWWFLGAGLLLTLVFHKPEPNPRQQLTWREWLPLALVVLGAFLLRFVNVGLFPYGVEGDEAGYGIVFETMQRHPMGYQNIFRGNNVGIFLYWLGALWMRLLGVSVLSLRLASVVYGTLSILTFYFMLRLAMRWQAALLAAVAIAFSTWHLHFSRFGHLNISQVFVQSACFYFFWKGMLQKRLWPFAVAGFCLGLTFMAHTAGKLVPLIFLVFLVYLALVHGRTLLRRTAGLLIFGAFAWATVAPVMVYYAKFPVQGTGRIKEVSIMNNQNSNAPADAVSGAAQNFRASMLMFNSTGDNRSRDNALAPQSMLDHWTGVFFLLGFGFALYYWRVPLYAFMLLAFFGTLSASVISVEAPQSLRTAGNIPVVFFFVGVLFDRLLDWGRAFPMRLMRWAVLGLLVALLGFMAQSNCKRFFGNTNYGWDLLPTMIGIHAGDLGPGYETHFFSENFGAGHPPVTLFARGATVRNHAELLESMPLRYTMDRGVCWAFSDRFRLYADYATWLYPQAKRSTIKTKTGEEIYDTITLSPAQVAQLYGIEGRVWDPAEGPAAAEPLLSQGIDYPKGLSPTSSAAASAEWKGTLFVPNWGEERFLADTPGEARVVVDGRELADSRQKGGFGAWVRLPIGPHSISLRFHGRMDQPLMLKWERRTAPSGGGYWALQGSTALEPITPALFLRTIQPHGLTERLYAGPAWDGPYTAKVDGAITGHWIDGPIGGPFSCRWDGKIAIEKEGNYIFTFNTPSFADIEVNGHLVDRRNASFMDGDARIPVKPLHLRPGTYPIKVRFATVTTPAMELLWSWEGTEGVLKMIPARLLTPAPLF